ncbi:MAG: hypothetical protein Q9220_002808 [cf. Caloplaca sp. 1 TL-2023]
MASQWPYGQQLPSNYGYPQPPNTYAQQAPYQYPQQQYQHYPQPPAQQYPTQYPQQSNQQYPPQYPQQVSQQPHQSSPQQYPPHYAQQPPQQHFPPQHEQHYPNQHPPAASTIQPQSGQQCCYNCGSPAHWAQNCPESKRDNPAGAYNRPPFKRQKPNPPVVTRYAVPPHVQQNQGPAPQVYGTTFNPPSHPQYQGTYGPPTPMSGQSPSQQQWQQQPHQQHQQQHYPQQPQYAQSHQQTSYQHPQPSYGQTAPPTPATPYSGYQAHQASPSVSQQNPASYFPNNSHQQYPGPQAPFISNASPASSTSHSFPHQQPQHPVHPPAETKFSPRNSRNSSVSMHSMSVTPKQQIPEATEEDDDDMSKLDIPDIPVITDGSFANLVDRPLPANDVVADALEPFDPPQPENNGRCRSKYMVIDASSTFMNCIRETRYWGDLKHDPVFLAFETGSSVIPLHQILSTYQSRAISEERDSAEVEEGEWTRRTDLTAHRTEGHDLMDKLEHTLSTEQSMKRSDRVAEDDSPVSRQRTNSVSHNKPTLPIGENFTLHVAGLPHRLDYQNTRPYPPPPIRAPSPPPSPERTPPLRSRTPSMYELDGYYPQGYGARPGSNLIDGLTLNSGTNGRHGLSADASDPFEPPPLPAHLRRPASYDGTCEGSLPAGSPKDHVNGKTMTDSHHVNGNGRASSNDQLLSPTRLRTVTANGRKRDHDLPILSDEDNTPKRRQVDDTKSKLKKRQPKVAAVYR